MVAVPSTSGSAGAYAEPPIGATYPLVLRGEGYAWWRSLGGILIAPLLWLLLGGIVGTLVLGLAWSLGHSDVEQNTFIAAARQYQYWEGMLSSHLQIALLLPICLLMLRSVHGVRPGFLWSVEGRPRWRFLATAAGIAVVVFAGYVAIGPLVGGEPLRWQPQEGLAGFLVVIVLIGPFQAAAEEFFFRGYLLQALGSLVSTPWFGVVTSALVFALFHGTQNAALFVSRFAFGLVVGWLVLRTGGLEAAIAAHVVNNTFAFVLAGVTSTISEVRTTTAVAWSQAFSDVLVYSVFTVLALAVAARMGVRRVVAAGPAQGPTSGT